MIERLRVRIPAGAEGEFSSTESTLCAGSIFGVLSTPVLPQKHIKDPGHSAKKCRWQVTPKNAYILDPKMLSGLIMFLSRHSAGTYPEMSSHATC